MATPTTSWDETSPAGSQSISLGDDRIREMKTQIREVISADHNMASSGNSDTTGHHNKATLLVNADDPTEQANAGIVYTKDVNSKAELFFKDEDANEVQLTSGGKIRAVVADEIGSGAVTPVKMARNIVSVRLSDSWSTTTAAEGQTRTGATVTITDVRASGSVLLHVRASFSGKITISSNARINRDSGAEYVKLGSQGQYLSAGTSTFVRVHSGALLFTGLSAGDHTFTLEVGWNSNVDTLYSACTSTDVCELIAEEV